MATGFEPYRRGIRDAASSERENSGIQGLNLFIVLQVALEPDGRVDAKSQDGRTRFTLSVPR